MEKRHSENLKQIEKNLQKIESGKAKFMAGYECECDIDVPQEDETELRLRNNPVVNRLLQLNLAQDILNNYSHA